MASFFISHTITAQQPATAFSVGRTITQLENALSQGNPRAYRELAGFMRDSSQQSRIREIIGRHSIFPPDIWEGHEHLDRRTFLNFLNQYSDSLHYHPILSAFLIRPLDKLPPPDYEIQYRPKPSPRQKSALLDWHLDVLNAASDALSEPFVRHQLDKIVRLNTAEGQHRLKEYLQGEGVSPALRQAPYLNKVVCEALAQHPKSEILDISLQQIKSKKITAEDGVPILRRLTFYEMPNPKGADAVAERYAELRDSLETLSAIRNWALSQQTGLRPEFFIAPVDYHARLAADFFEKPWIRDQALSAMLETGHPRALYHLAALLYAHRNDGIADLRPLEQKLFWVLDVRLWVRDAEGQLQSLSEVRRDGRFYLNFAKYWARHHTDYEWDGQRQVFVNVKMRRRQEARASLLFQQMGAEAEQTAFSAFRALSRHPPDILDRLIEQHPEWMERANPVLPDFQYGFLQQLSRLHAFMEGEGLPLALPEREAALLDSLKGKHSLRERYRLEDSLIRRIQPRHFSLLEREGLIYSQKPDFNFSISRVLAVAYDRHFDRIFRNRSAFRLFLKKTVLFERLGAGGFSNQYFARLQQLPPEAESMLRRMLLQEYDSDIRDLLLYLLDAYAEEKDAGIPLRRFLENPSAFDEREIGMLRPPEDKRQRRRFFRRLRKCRDSATLLQYVDYLDAHFETAMVPSVFRFLGDSSRILSQEGGRSHSLSDAVVQMLEYHFDYSFRKEGQPARASARKWKSWRREHPGITDWRPLFLKRKIRDYLQRDSLDVEALNEFLRSEYLREEQRRQILSALSKVYPAAAVRHIEPPRPLAAAEWRYFQGRALDRRYWDDVLELFDPSERALVALADSLLRPLPPEERGRLANRFLNREPFLQSLLQSSPEVAGRWAEDLQAYWDNAEWLSEVEEQRLLERTFLLRHTDAPLLEKFKASQSYAREAPEMVARLQTDLLAQAQYSDLSELLSGEQAWMRPGGPQSHSALVEKILGLPAALLEAPQDWAVFLEDLRSMEAEDLMLEYLSRSGRDLRQADGRLDYEAVMQLLRFDFTEPFSNPLAGNRTYRLKATLRLLGMLHPEAGISYQGESLREEADAWIDFLRKEKG